MEYTIGTKIPSMPGWEIVRELGEGSYGKVFEVHKNNYDVTTKAALKLIRIPKSVSEIREAMSEGMDEQSVTTYFEGIVKRFVKEIAVMSELKSHPNIVACEDYEVESHAGNIGWDILIRMELLTPLVNYQLKNPMNEEIVKRLAIDICEALVFCQKKGLVHRDIKSANIFVDETGQFKLGDFGVARTAEKTIGGYSKQGTENYMAPEVYLGRPYGATVDIYSLGLVLYRLMNGNRLPFYPAAPKPIDFSHRENALVARMRGDIMPPPCNASEEFAAIILKACAYDSKNRYRTAAEMLEALKNLSKNPSVQVDMNEDEESQDDYTFGSIGIDFGKSGKTEGETIDSQDEESIGSIGIFWGKKENDEKTEVEDEKEQGDDLGTNAEHEEEKKEKSNSSKVRSIIVKALGAVVGVFIIVMLILAGRPEKESPDEISEAENPVESELIKIGVLEAPMNANPWWNEGNIPAIEAAFESRPTVVIDDVEYQVELVYSSDVPSYSAEPFSEITHYQEAADYFKMNECSAVIALYHGGNAINSVAGLGIPFFVTDYYNADGDGLDMLFALEMTEENFEYLQAQFILNQIPEAANSNKMLVLYDEQQPDPIISLEQRDRFITTFKACGGEVVYASVSDQLQLEDTLLAAAAADEYSMIYAGLLYGNVMPEDVLITRDTVYLEMLGGSVPVVPVIVDRNDQEMLNKYANTYNLMNTFNSEFFNFIREKNGENSASDTQGQLFSAYYMILDALETDEELVSALKNGEFVGAHGNVTFDEENQAVYDSIQAVHQSVGGIEPEYFTYTVE